MAVCRDVGSASTMTVKYGSAAVIHIIRTQILAAQESNPHPPPPLPLPQNKYHSQCHASCIRRNVSCRPQMLLAGKEIPISTTTAKKKDRVRHAAVGAKQRNTQRFGWKTCKKQGEHLEDLDVYGRIYWNRLKELGWKVVE